MKEPELNMDLKLGVTKLQLTSIQQALNEIDFIVFVDSK
jgi:hypothetical protein